MIKNQERPKERGELCQKLFLEYTEVENIVLVRKWARDYTLNELTEHS